MVRVPFPVGLGLVLGLLWQSPQGLDKAGQANRMALTPSTSMGRWGTLTATPIVISPPLELIPKNVTVEPSPWFFPNATLDSTTALLRSAGLTPAELALATPAMAVSASPKGVMIKPPRALIRSLAPAVRARLYGALSLSPLNYDQQTAYRFEGTVDEWLGRGYISEQTRALVEPLLYRLGDFVYFADVEYVRGELGGSAEMQRLIKRLLRQSTLLVSLRIDESTDLDAVVDYWSRGRSRTDIRPLLESLTDPGQDRSIDIVHLLPELPRRLLYRYQKITLAALQQPGLDNCFWTALNFFATEPDDRFLDPAAALKQLKDRYYLVQDDLQLGDIVVLSDPDGSPFHAAVYLADDLVFTKNGSHYLQPWSILRMSQLKGHFSEHGSDWRVSYFRRNDF